MDVCQVVGCAGPNHSGALVCDRHLADADAPPMLLTCECPFPDVQRLSVYGAGAAQCRSCGSPIAGTRMSAEVIAPAPTYRPDLLDYIGTLSRTDLEAVACYLSGYDPEALHMALEHLRTYPASRTLL